MLLREIKATNLLSFGPQGMSLELRPLNILIGPNGSGKSNLLSAISLLKAAPRNLADPIRSEGDSTLDWIWKQSRESSASLEVVVEGVETSLPPDGQNGLSLRHRIEFKEMSRRFQLTGELIEPAGLYPNLEPGTFFYRYAFKHGANLRASDGSYRDVGSKDLVDDESILSQRTEPVHYPEITHLGRLYDKIRQYREWTFGRHAQVRQPQKADLRNDYLESDGSNLGLILNRLRGNTETKQAIREHLRDLFEGIKDFDVSVQSGAVQVLLEEDECTFPATRLSDGTLRYLYLLAILCDPEPPPLICIEEPELGLHPDILPGIADLMAAASERTQLIVTTHAEILVDKFTERPEAVIVCEKENGQTSMKRLDELQLKGWLDDYRLGQMWLKGMLGGVRW